jgi:cytochrome c-type biogenesis protein CcmF
MALLGRSLILLALAASSTGALVAFAAGLRSSPAGAALARRLAYLFAAAMVAANLLMVAALLARDFSVGYVAQVGSRQVPDWVAVTSLWSSLEGSILFWGAVLGVYVTAATWTNRDRHPEYMPYAIGTWLACGAFFSFLLAGPAQPFLSVPNPPAEGPGPNPLLQNHLLMVVHPPFLYLGYVGMTIPFGLASAALLRGRLGHDFLKPLRTWLMVPWIFLTIAIMLGAWWAYDVLGWGGYWAWDPVENASFLPWLTATAAVHSVILTERKGVLKGWTATLVLVSFLLTILGTFMTRSGVFNSVHSFTQSAIGPTILSFLATATLWSVLLLAARIDRLAPEGRLEGVRSRDGMFLLNNLLLVLFTFTVLIGTVFPLVVEAVRGVQMSVGRPYFDRMAVPLGVALLFVMGVGPALPWGRATGEQLRRALLPPLGGAAVLALLGFGLGVRHPWTLVALAFAGFTAQVTLREMWLPVRQRRSRGEKLLPAIVEGELKQGRRRFGGYVVHAGAILVVTAIAVSSTMSRSRELVLDRNESATFGRYGLTFLGTDEVREPQRTSLVARIAVTRDGEDIGVLAPRMSQYESQREPVGSPAVRSFLFEDLYLSIMNLDAGGGKLGLHVFVNPMVGWIWPATMVMALGGLLALLPPTRRRVVVHGEAVASSPALGLPSESR